MAQVTTQAPLRTPQQPPNQSVQDLIKSLKFDLKCHFIQHTETRVFDPNCSECIYWSMNVIQHPDIWDENYRKQHADNLIRVPHYVANYAVKMINKMGYPLALKAREMTEQEYLQVVSGQ